MVLTMMLDFQKDGLKDIEQMQAELAEAGYKRSVNNLFAVYLKVLIQFSNSLLTPIEQKFLEL